MNTNQIVTIRSPEIRDSESFVILEQKEWSNGGNKITRLDLVSAISDAVYGTEEDDKECEIKDGKYESVLYAFPYPFNLNLSFGITHGVLGTAVVSEHTVVELVSFELTSEQETTYPMLMVDSLEWYSDLYSQAGEILPALPLSISGNSIQTTAKVYGTVLVTYKTLRYSMGVNVTAREDSPYTAYESVGWCRWDGGVELLKLEPPEQAEEQKKFDTNCRNYSILEIVPDDDPDPKPPVPDSTDRTFYVDYCTQTWIGGEPD